jgi:hypothetical protein
MRHFHANRNFNIENHGNPMLAVTLFLKAIMWAWLVGYLLFLIRLICSREYVSS